MDSTLLWNFFIAAIAIVNPLGKVPVWVDASENCEGPVRMRLAVMVAGTATLVLLIFLLFGRYVLAFLGIDLPAFRVGGGIIILLLGISMLHGRAVDIDHRSGQEGDDALDRAKARFRHVVVPVAIPILAGPGSITTVLLFGYRADDWWERGSLAVVLVAVMGVVLLILLLGRRIQNVLGDLVLSVQTRVWGLLLTAIAAQLILVGLGESFPNWLDPTSPLLDDVRQSAEAK